MTEANTDLDNGTVGGFIYFFFFKSRYRQAHIKDKSKMIKLLMKEHLLLHLYTNIHYSLSLPGPCIMNCSRTEIISLLVAEKPTGET